MKKLLTLSGIVLLFMVACNDNSTKETTTTTDSTKTAGTESKEKQISDSTKMLDKKLADPNVKYSPDSLK